jgi:transposase
LRDEHGYAGGITIVKDYVLARRQQLREVFVPLRHDPGHAQADFGEAVAVIDGVERKIHFFAMDLPHSDACFVQAYPAETTEAFCEGHNAAFGFFGKVPQSILYDNTRLAVARILGMGHGSGRGCSANCNRITCLLTASAVLARAMTRARLRV